MKKNRMLISLAGLVVVVATTASVAAYTLAGDGSSAPAAESAGTQEPAFQDDKLSILDPAPDTIYDGKGGVSVTNPDVQGSTGIPDPDGQAGEIVKVDDPPAGKVVPIGKFDGDVGPMRDPGPTHVDPPLHGDPEPTHGDPKAEGDAPDIEPLQGHGTAVDKPSPEYEVLELAKLDLAERLGLADTDSIRWVGMGGTPSRG